MPAADIPRAKQKFFMECISPLLKASEIGLAYRAFEAEFGP